jgi:ubiquinone biosynthesis protein
MISLKPQHLKRYKDLAWLFMKYGRADLVRKAGLEDVVEERDGEAPTGNATDLAADLERLGPTFIKLGQLLSTRSDLLPAAYTEGLTRLQDNCDPFSFAEVEQIVASELGVRISKAFATFESTPTAAASLGQVHRATLRDGRAVAVKVQRPGIREVIFEDLEALREIADVLDSYTERGRQVGFAEILEEFRRSLFRELDYREEAQNLLTLGRNLAEFERIVVPAPIADYTTSKVLTMTYIRGTKITTLSPVVRLEVNGAGLNEQLFQAYLKQVLVDGFFHADPHPGNIFLTEDGRIALLDLGMVGWVTSQVQDHLLQLLLAISEGRGDDAAEFAVKLGEVRDHFDKGAFNRQVNALVVEHQHASLKDIKVGKIVMRLTEISGASGVRLPAELTMFGKALLNLDGIARTLDPGFDPNASIRQNAAAIMRQRLLKSASPGNLFSSLLEVKEFATNLPRRINKLLETVANNELEVKVDAIDERLLIEGLQKIANRITLGLVLAALIVGAAMLMSVPTSFRIWGYPGLAMILFLAAATGGVVLMLNILASDVKAKKKP